MSDQNRELERFLATDVNGAFEFAWDIQNSKRRPSARFLAELRELLPTYMANVDCRREGNRDWAHLVAGLMIAEHCDRDGFAAAAAPFLANPNVAVWTSAYNLLLRAAQIDRKTYEAILSASKQCPHDCRELLEHVQHILIE